VSTDAAPVVGLDPSLTGFAVCVLRRDGSCDSRRFQSFRLGHDVCSRIDRALMLVESIMQVIPQDTLLACIEGYAYGTMQQRAKMDLAELGGILRADLMTLCDRIYEVPPSQLKQWTTGNGMATKELMQACVADRWGREFDNFDESDAYAIARLAGCIAGFWDPEDSTQHDVIRKVLEARMTHQKKGVHHGRSHRNRKRSAPQQGRLFARYGEENSSK